MVFDLVLSAILGTTALTATLVGLAAAGHFPAANRIERLRDPVGVSVLWGAMIIAVVSIAVAILSAGRSLPWPYIVIACGLGILGAPQVLTSFPDSVVDGRRGLLMFAAVTVLSATVVRAFA